MRTIGLMWNGQKFRVVELYFVEKFEFFFVEILNIFVTRWGDNGDEEEEDDAADEIDFTSDNWLDIDWDEVRVIPLFCFSGIFRR